MATLNYEQMIIFDCLFQIYDLAKISIGYNEKKTEKLQFLIFEVS